MIDDTEEGLSSHPGRPRDDHREHAILVAAIELLLEVGYEKMTMDSVAARAHASKATIYRRWTGKAELVADAVRCYEDDATVATFATRGSLRADLIWLVSYLALHLGADNGRLVAGVLLAMQSDATLAELIRSQVIGSKCTIAETVVRHAISRRELGNDVNPAILSEILPAVVLTRVLITGGSLDENFALLLVDEILIPLLTHGRPQLPSTQVH